MWTNFNTVIGSYNPEQWEDTTGMKDSRGMPGWKDITSGFPFLFYWVRDEIQIIKHRADQIPVMRSNKDYLMYFAFGPDIYARKNEYSYACVSEFSWVIP